MFSTTTTTKSLNECEKLRVILNRTVDLIAMWLGKTNYLFNAEFECQKLEIFKL